MPNPTTPHLLSLEVAYRAAFELVSQYLELEKQPDEGLILLFQYLRSDPARWEDWITSVQRAVSADGENPLVDNLWPTSLGDLAKLPRHVREGALIEPNGEVLWSVSDVPGAVRALAEAGLVVLSTRVRNFDADGRFTEVAWSDYSGTDAEAGRDAALTAIQREDIPGDWILVTW